jgi:hypothetical protein
MFGLLACVGLLGCSMTNPAFDDARATEATDEADTKDPTAETGDPGTSSSTTTDPSTDTSDTDDDSETDTSDTGPIEVCDFLTRPALRLELEQPDNSECLPTVSDLFLRVSFDGINQPTGMATGIACETQLCEFCTPLTYSVGAPGFTGLADVWSAIAAIVEPEGVDGLCVEVAATKLVGLIDGACVYESLGIFDNTIELGPVFVGNVGNAPLTWISDAALGQQPLPSLANEPLGTCSCEGAHEQIEDIGCCDQLGVDPQFHALSFLGHQVEPGMFKDVQLNQAPWRFHAVQAQAVASCENPRGKPEISWALARVQ